MQLSSLRPARDFAINYGVKAIIYGPPGGGKTPAANTAPRPVMMACEPGLLSMRNSNIPTWTAFDAARQDEFFKWLFHSNETKGFDTVVVDSGSQMAENYLQRANQNNKHGLAAYGQMARDSMENFRGMYYMPQKHIYIVAKQEFKIENGITMRRPYYPGQQLPIDVPHMYDAILQLDIHSVPNVGQVKAFRCIGSMDTVARNRTGTLAEFEPPDFGALVRKAMQ